MSEDVYRRLAAHLDNLPAGYPSTDSGVELRILKRFFSPDEAELALHLTLIPEAPRVIARRAGINPSEAARRLEEMAMKGQVFRDETSAEAPLYMAAQYVIGIWEFHVDDLDKDVIRDMEEYIPILMDTAWKQPQLRTIPVNQSVHNELNIMTYEIAASLVHNHDRFSINPCICHRERTMVGEGCNKPEASCLTFGTAADYYIRNGYGRECDKQEVLDFLEKADEIGLVLQPGNSRETSVICCCCGCCCAVLRTLKTLPRPVDWVASPFVAVADRDTCAGCGLCEDRCQMDALSQIDGAVALDADRCIGCGLCVSTCPTESLSLARKPEREQPVVPVDNVASVISHGRARGKLGLGELIRMQVKSKVDRFLAPR